MDFIIKHKLPELHHMTCTAQRLLKQMCFSASCSSFFCTNNMDGTVVQGALWHKGSLATVLQIFIHGKPKRLLKNVNGPDGL